MEIANPLVVRYFYYSHGVENYATDTSVSEAERNYAVMSVVFLQKLQAGRGPHATSSTTEERNTNNNFFELLQPNSPTALGTWTGSRHVMKLKKVGTSLSRPSRANACLLGLVTMKLGDGRFFWQRFPFRTEKHFAKMPK